MPTARENAERFVRDERAFHLGALLTESPHPKTTTLSRTIARDVEAGIRMLAAVDADVPPAAHRVLAGEEVRRLAEAIERALRSGRRVIFTGCGSTGRLSILLEAAWRRFWRELRRNAPALAARLPDLEDRVASVMAGGDFALIRAVEGFEDFTDFGRHQLTELGATRSDVVVAITEGGETSFVIGTAWQGLDLGAEVFFVFNNPADALRTHVLRSREVLDEARIVKLDLTTGPMAIAGSTRMQATTAELLIVGAALEMALGRLLAEHLTDDELARLGAVPREPADYAKPFADLVIDLASPAAIAGMAEAVQFEEEIYRAGGLVTYLADAFLLDVLTDTTERSPTFRLPPFRKAGDTVAARSWAFVKNPWLSTEDAWRDALGREPRGLDWDADTYRRLDAPPSLQEHPPALDRGEIHKFTIGNEPDPSRWDAADSAVMGVVVRGRAAPAAEVSYPPATTDGFHRRAVLCVGPERPKAAWADGVFHVPCRPATSPLALWERLAIKLALNTLSTATMARLGRVLGNWMHWVAPSNKKLIDRGTRLIAELTGLPYAEACVALHETMEELEPRAQRTQDAPSPVALAVERIGLRDRYRASPLPLGEG
ncbi:MAG: hypothetical protein JW809_09850 [Pirellulales bacterium]|nr:hypothetical protein [Pirellulales bacterium]